MRLIRTVAFLTAGLLATLGLAAQSFEKVPAPQPAAPQPAAAPAAVPGGIAIVNVQAALVNTQEGQKAAAELQERFRPMQVQIETLRQEVADLQRRVQEGQRTLSQEAQLELAAEIESKAKRGRRLEEDFQEDTQRAQNEMLARLSEKMRTVIAQLAEQRKFSLIIPVTPQNAPIYVAPGVNITQELIRLYDQAHPVVGAAAAPANPGPARK